jgi:hypothetical protein
VPTERYAFAFDRRFARPLALLGIRPATAEVALTDTGLTARFGRFRLSTPWSNVRDVQVTRGYRWFKAIGPRGSLADRGATFGTNAEAGTCVCFHEPVPALAGRRFAHPALTVTVADPEGLAATIRRRLAGVHEGSAPDAPDGSSA